MILRFFAILMFFCVAGCSASGGGDGSASESSTAQGTNALSGSSSGGEPEETEDLAWQPDVVFIIVDTLRADHVSFFGYQRNTTPNIDAFARESYAFSNAISPAPWTVPAFASIMTGMHAFNHNKANVYDLAEPVSHPTIGRYMEDAGYSTVSVQTNVFLEHMDYEFQGRHHYFDDSVFLDELAAQEALDVIGGLTATSSKKPLFLFMGLISPHWPYRPDTRYFEEFVFDELYEAQPQAQTALESVEDALTYDSIPPSIKGRLGPPVDGGAYYKDARLYQAAYDGEIKYSDSRIGRILDELRRKGLYDGAMIIITADHGENMVDHEPHFWHGDSLFNSQIHVPLFIKMPGQSVGRIITAYVRTIDILPTIVDAIGQDALEVDGRSLASIMAGLPEEQSYPIVSYLTQTTASMGVVTKEFSTSLIEGAYKLIRQNDPGMVSTYLYDLDDDPNEQSNIAYSRQYTGMLSEKTVEIEVLIQGN